MNLLHAEPPFDWLLDRMCHDLVLSHAAELCRAVSSGSKTGERTAEIALCSSPALAIPILHRSHELVPRRFLALWELFPTQAAFPLVAVALK